VLVDTIDSQVSVNTVDGDVDLVEIIGSTRVNVISGQIISQITLPLDGAIEQSIIKGRIDSEITLLSDGTIDMSVLEGSINLDIPQNTSATFAADVVEGNIRLLDLVLQDQVRTSHSLTGTLGDGRGDIVLETDIGNITVNGF
jgi:DUF4097 and DUF4098 domain-containing protein YvlB